MRKLFLILQIVCVLSTAICAQEFEKYEFPISPTDVEWKNNSYPERLKILDIDETVLKELTNKELIGAILEYPYTINTFAFNTIDDGYQNVYNNFSGLRELHSRDNIGDDLIFFYMKMRIDGYENELKSFNDSYDVMKLAFFEILLSQEDILAKLDNEQKKQLVEECIMKYYAKENDTRIFENEPIFSNLSKKQSLMIACKLMIMDGGEKAKQTALSFISSKFFSKNEIDGVISSSRKLY